jgi:hypothetical protein
MSSDPEIPRRGPRVFVSYAFRNPHIKAFEAGLIARGFQPTVVNDKTLLGQPSLSGAIQQLIRNSDYVLPLIDEAASRSTWVGEEISIALMLQVPIIPVLEHGVDPIAVLKDIPCLIGTTVDVVADRILADYALLNFDVTYPAHIQKECLIEYMGNRRRMFIDSDLRLSSGIAPVVSAVCELGHKEMSKQITEYWKDLQESITQLEKLLPHYGEILKTLLKEYKDRNSRAVDSWNAVTRLFIGHNLIRFATMYSPEWNPAWGELRGGAQKMLAEWEAVDEQDPAKRHWLWGIGRRQFQLEDWPKDDDSPLGKWILAMARFYDGEWRNIILPNEKNIDVGLRLREPPKRFLEPWHWIDYILPQIAYRCREKLRPELGTGMLVELQKA